MSHYFTQRLVCPQCQTPLLASTDPTRLLCPHCRVAYRAEEGIWILLASEAKPLTPDEVRLCEHRSRVGDIPTDERLANPT